MERIDEDKIIEEFNNEEEIWPQSDKWHTYTHHKIQSFINENNSQIESTGVIINAGSSGEDYGIPEENVLHIDIAQLRYMLYVVLR